MRQFLLTFALTGPLFGALTALLDGQTGSLQEYWDAVWPAALFFGTFMGLARIGFDWWNARRERA
jgi:hypothetical protein